MMKAKELILEKDFKLKDLLDTDEDLEASGVVKVDGYYYVVEIL